jgi:hypothetical protein
MDEMVSCPWRSDNFYQWLSSQERRPAAAQIWGADAGHCPLVMTSSEVIMVGIIVNHCESPLPTGSNRQKVGIVL